MFSKRLQILCTHLLSYTIGAPLATVADRMKMSETILSKHFVM